MTSGGARGGAVSSGTALQTSRSWVRFSMVSLELTQPLTEISTRNISWGGGGGEKRGGGVENGTPFVHAGRLFKKGAPPH